MIYYTMLYTYIHVHNNITTNIYMTYIYIYIYTHVYVYVCSLMASGNTKLKRRLLTSLHAIAANGQLA